jgi:hypothetical protein
MTPKEKAEDLLHKFSVHEFNETIGWFINKRESKECAKMVVEEAILYHPFPTEPDEIDIKFHNYWKEVKTEIEKL